MVSYLFKKITKTDILDIDLAINNLKLNSAFISSGYVPSIFTVQVNLNPK